MDDRLGRKNEDGSIDRWPERYPDGMPWSRLANGAPTTLMIDNRHFVVLPLSIGGIPEELKQELLKTIGGAMSVDTVSSRNKKAKDIEDEDAVG